uniref:hypothetical protein n=1 Tax=Limnohabitans sp. TaxID=1907725 RepID=UPI004047AF60
TLWAMVPCLRRRPPPWAMGVAHALKTIAHRVRSYNEAPCLRKRPPPWTTGVAHALKTIAHRVGSCKRPP